MIIYFLVALFATLIGSLAGMGGGVIIKPILDMLGDYNITTISILSSITVLSMAIVATARQVKKGFKITDIIIITTIGAVFGGVLGSILFNQLKAGLNPNTITIIQSAVLILLLVLCLMYEKLPHMHIQSMILKGIVGVTLGLFSSFLGIGGGPINVAVLCLLFNFEIRQAARVSVFIILFSQIAGLITKGISGSFASMESYMMLYVMIPAAIIGGLVGTRLNLSISDKSIKIIFKTTIVLVMVICLYNIIRNGLFIYR